MLLSHKILPPYISYFCMDIALDFILPKNTFIFMNKSLRHTGIFKGKNLTVKTNLPVFIFEENDLSFCYCAPLDLYGYGKTEVEAKKSFETGLAEFLKYTQNKGTLTRELKRLGWKVLKETKKTPQYIAPEFVDMVNKNKDLNRIMTDIPNVRKYNQSIRIPAYA